MSKLSLEKEYCPPVHIRWAIRPDPDSASLKWSPTTQPQQTPGPVPKPSQAVPTVAANLQWDRQSVLHAEQQSNKHCSTKTSTIHARFPCGSCSFPATSSSPFRVQNSPRTRKTPRKQNNSTSDPPPPRGACKTRQTIRELIREGSSLPARALRH